MLEKLLLLERLYQLDQQRDATWDAIRGLKADVVETSAHLAQADAELSSLEQARDALTAQEQALTVRLDKYVARRARTREQLDEGAIPDYLRAERQVANYDEIIDGLELELLELMERHEGLDHKHMAVRHRRRTLALRQGQEQARLDDEGATLGRKLESLNQQRKGQKSSLAPHLLHDYEQLRTRHRDAVVHLEDGNCQGCRRQHPKQVINEVRRGDRVHRCRSCTRFLIGLADPKPELSEPGEADEVKGGGSRVDG